MKLESMPALKHIRTLIQSDFDVHVVLFPENEDPDSFMQKNGLSSFRSFIEENERNFLEFIVDIKLGNDREDPIKIASAARFLAEHLALLKDPLKRSAFIQQAIKTLNIDEQVLVNEINKLRVKGSGVPVREITEPQPLPPQFQQQEEKVNYQVKQLLRSLILFADREYSEEQSIAEFIFEELELDGMWPKQDPFAQIFKDAHKHLEETKSLNELFFIRNPQSSAMAAADILSHKYTLSEAWEKNYEKFIPTEDKNYKKEVIENLNYLKLHRIEEEIEENQKRLREDLPDEEIMNIQISHQRLLELKKKITDVIGAVVYK